MTNLLSSFNSETILSALGYILAFILVFAVFYIRRKYPNLTKVIDSIICVLLTLVVMLGVKIVVTSKPDLALIMVIIFLIIVPCAIVFVTSLKHANYLIKTIFKRQEINVIVIIFSILTIICLIVCVINLFYVFNVILN